MLLLKNLNNLRHTRLRHGKDKFHKIMIVNVPVIQTGANLAPAHTLVLAQILFFCQISFFRFNIKIH
jgi:hypothetical protein